MKSLFSRIGESGRILIGLDAVLAIVAISATVWLCLLDQAEAGCNPPSGEAAVITSFTVTDVASGRSQTVDTTTAGDNGGTLYICEPSAGGVEIMMTADATNKKHIGWRIEKDSSMSIPCQSVKDVVPTTEANENEGPVLSLSSLSGCPTKDNKSTLPLTTSRREFYVKTFCDMEPNCEKSAAEDYFCDEGHNMEVKVVIIKVDLDSDIDNDGDIDDDDEPLEEVDLGEVIRVNDTDDIDGDSDGTDEEDDLQYLEMKIEPTLTEGKVWFTYNTSKVKLWKTMAMGTGDAIPSGSYATPTWDLGAGDTLPAYVFAEGLATTAETDTEASRQIILHWGNGTADCTDTLLTTVTKDLGHYAYFAAVPDYIKEKRSPGEPDYRLFDDEVDSPGGPAGMTHNLVAVLMEETTSTSHDARAAGHKYQGHVKTAFSDAVIIANGAFFETEPDDFGETIGICVEGGSQIVNSRPMSGTWPDDDPHYSVMGWVGQAATTDTWTHQEPKVEPPTTGSIRAATGGLIAFYPTYEGKSITDIANAVSLLKTSASHIMGWDDDAGVLYFVASQSGGDYSTPIDLAGLITDIVSSGADVVYGLDGSSSIALLHKNRLNNNLQLYGSPGGRHSGLVWPFVERQRVVHYIIINWKP